MVRYFIINVERYPEVFEFCSYDQAYRAKGQMLAKGDHVRGPFMSAKRQNKMKGCSR